ncbi:proline iminopeptidase [Exophiala viscosa]|uniref:Proline iminopeptidase n=1 Tax=Exophiala viscosa TaxID=2486360 RepID=A0AAN6E665_9EURO|nr:proline iminopeptidase [Exophiala viscosa]KAI1629122.1 proline iminopeptidase [Exophiala viscosa]
MASQGTTTVSTVKTDDGVNLHVKVLGDDATKRKPLLISLHGAPGLSTHMEPEASFAFLSDTFRVLVYDARGSGISDHIGPYTHDRWIKDIEILRQWAGAETFVLAGASYGAFIALDYAILHGDRLYGLLLRGAWANGKLGPMNALANILTSHKVKVDVARQVRVWSGTLRNDEDYEAAILELLPFYTPPEDESATATTEEKPESTEFKGTVKYHSATQNFAFSVNQPRFDVRDQLHTIKAPTLVVVGRHDNVTPVECSREIADKLPHARLEIFEKSGHSPPSDEPQKFEAVVADWLKADVLPVLK